jgi:hypothetical protein
MARRYGILALAALGLATAAAAETRWGDLTPAEHAAFARELRDALLAEPEIVARALQKPNPVQSAYEQQVEDDLSLLKRLAPQILGDSDIALFIQTDCESCALAEKELRSLSETSGASFKLHDLSDPQAAALAKELGLQEAPFYVLPRMVLRGQMPAVVLNRYLRRD